MMVLRILVSSLVCCGALKGTSYVRSRATALSARVAEPVGMSMDGSEDAAAKAARQARRQAILEASQRAAQRMQTLQQGQAPPPPPVEEPPPPREEPPPEEPPSLKRDEPDGLSVASRDRQLEGIRERFMRAPEGYTPYYNTGDAYLDDLAADSSERHWSNNANEGTLPLESINRQFGSRPDTETTPPYQPAVAVKPPAPAPVPAPDPAPEGDSRPTVAEKLPAPAPAPVPTPALAHATLDEPSGDLTEQERATISRGVAGLVQYVQTIQSSGVPPSREERIKLKQQLDLIKDILIEDAARTTVEVPPTPPEVATAPPVASPAAPIAAPVVQTSAASSPPSPARVALETLDAAGVAARIAGISPAFAAYGPKIEAFACDGRFLASLSPRDLDETLEDIGVTERLQRRRIAYELGLSEA